MNRTIKDATVKRYFYETHDQLRAHLARLRRRLQLRQTPQDSQRLHSIRVRLQNLDFTARKIHSQPAPANAGTKHLAQSVTDLDPTRPPARSHLGRAFIHWRS